MHKELDQSPSPTKKKPFLVKESYYWYKGLLKTILLN